MQFLKECLLHWRRAGDLYTYQPSALINFWKCGYIAEELIGCTIRETSACIRWCALLSIKDPKSSILSNLNCVMSQDPSDLWDCWIFGTEKQTIERFWLLIANTNLSLIQPSYFLRRVSILVAFSPARVDKYPDKRTHGTPSRPLTRLLSEYDCWDIV